VTPLMIGRKLVHITPNDTIQLDPKERKTLLRAKKLAKKAQTLAQRKNLPPHVSNDLIDIEVVLTALCTRLTRTD
jgi:hypothetical protein